MHNPPPVRSDKLNCSDVLALKGREPIAVLTAYDHPTARLLDEAGIPVLLVGDSLGMVVLGFPDTTCVTMDHMLHHVAAVARARPKALIGADLPHLSYRTPEEGVANARRLLEAGADFVKAEGGQEILSVVKALRAAYIPFCGHLGMLPQHIHEEGGKYRIKGRDEAGRQRLLEDARCLEDAGAFACVLELVTPSVTAEITRNARRMVTIGIGSGPDCDGQVLVTPDLIGSFPWFTPKFVQPRLQVGRDIQQAATSWKAGLVLPGLPPP